MNNPDPHFRAELLRERIYSTLVLLAVLLTLDDHHTSPLKAALLVGGTALSIWAASLAADLMSYRVVMQRTHSEQSFRRRLELHAPLLLAAIFPLFFIGLAGLNAVSLTTAINIAITASLILLLSWSLWSARALKAGRVTTLIVAATELAVGLAIVGLKTLVGH